MSYYFNFWWVGIISAMAKGPQTIIMQQCKDKLLKPF